MRRRGMTLIGLIYMAALMVALHFVIDSAIDSARDQISIHKHRQAAYWMAVSGVDFAETALASGRWTYGRRYQSPPTLRGGSFEIQMTPDAYLVRGSAGGQNHFIKKQRRRS